MKTAIIYGSGFTGHTKKIAEYMAEKLKADVFNAKNLNDFAFEEYNKIIIGTNVHFGKPNKHALNFEVQNSDKVACRKPSLFIVCSSKDEKGEAQAKKIAGQFSIDDYIFFPSSDKNDKGMPKKLSKYISQFKE